MYATSWIFSNSKQYQPATASVDCLHDGDLTINIAYQEVYNAFKLACDENDILNTVLEVVKFDNGTCTVNEHFFSLTAEQAQNFQKKIEPVVKLFGDNGWTTSVETQENVDFEWFEQDCSRDPSTITVNSVELVDVDQPFYMWQQNFPTETE